MNTCSVNILKGLLVSLAIVAAFVFSSNPIGFKARGYIVEAEFENVGGLKVNSEILMNNVIVGKVSDIKHKNEGYIAIVSMLIDHSHQLPVDTEASVLTSGLLSEHYIGLDPGAEEEYLKSGDLIKLTQPALAFEQVIGRLLYSRGQEDLPGEKNL